MQNFWVVGSASSRGVHSEISSYEWDIVVLLAIQTISKLRPPLYRRSHYAFGFMPCWDTSSHFSSNSNNFTIAKLHHSKYNQTEYVKHLASRLELRLQQWGPLRLVIAYWCLVKWWALHSIQIADFEFFWSSMHIAVFAVLFSRQNWNMGKRKPFQWNFFIDVALWIQTSNFVYWTHYSTNWGKC